MSDDLEKSIKAIKEIDDRIHGVWVNERIKIIKDYLLQRAIPNKEEDITLGMMWPRTEDDKLTVRLEGTQEQIIPYELWNSERGSKIIISMLYPTMTVEQAKVQETGEFILDIEEEEFDSFYKDIGLEIPKKEWEE